MSSQETRPRNLDARKKRITFIHPDLGIGGAERLVIDAALALQAQGHRVTIYTSYRDKSHCFEEAHDGRLDVRIRGDKIFPRHIGGRFHVLMAIARQLNLVFELLRERYRARKWVEKKEEREVYKENDSRYNMDRKGVDDHEANEEDMDDIFFVDQLPACIPILKIFGISILGAATPEEEFLERAAENDPLSDTSSQNLRDRKRSRILFYAHFPDLLLSRKDEGSPAFQRLKALYRYPFDWFEGWAMSASDKVVGNSDFSRNMTMHIFGKKIGDVGVVYPCVDTEEKKASAQGQEKQQSLFVDGKLWDGKRVLLSINRFERKKNIGLAIKAYHGLGQEHRKGTRLVIAGGYDNRVSENVQYHAELEELARSLGLKTTTYKTGVSALSASDDIDVVFLLSVPTLLKETLLRAATLLLYTPSHEHFGIVPVEAMWKGLPVLAVNTGGPLETIADGETGWLRTDQGTEQWTEVMRKVLWDMSEEELERMGEKGKARVEEKFSLRAMGQDLEKVIEEMLDREPRGFLELRHIALFVQSLLLLVVALLLTLLRVWTSQQ